jgi:hypothetical protein
MDGGFLLKTMISDDVRIPGPMLHTSLNITHGQSCTRDMKIGTTRMVASLSILHGSYSS